ncbi:uncharacterized protein LOC123442224 [Hordeum vulgare subsp. vulgare]|uniref:uncharacterized protein LOC123442224 n=1 Tax=Hordeum vulgare subsp. vulgare TaxID=112509 RepID=UPI001D1A41AA|nr:uncharacterized protein LOC123442224 [Hordeum vulgare subsp. vulgare]
MELSMARAAILAINGRSASVTSTGRCMAGRSSEETDICGIPCGMCVKERPRYLAVRPATRSSSCLSRAFFMRSFCLSCLWR